MVTRDTAWPAGTPCWIDVAVDDIDKASTFYRGIFGWDVQAGPPEVGRYAICLKDGRAVAGIGQRQQGTPAAWTTYLASDDADETIAKVRAAGGQVLLEPIDVMDQVRIAIAADPGGAVFGVWQARAFIGFGLANEPGSLTWNENYSRDFEGNKGFYHSVFGYDFYDTGLEGSNYATIMLNGGPVGGIGELGPGSLPHWSINFAVEDPHKAVANAAQLGGAVLEQPQDTPYGSTAMLSDSQGAAFSVTTMGVVTCPHGRPTFHVNGDCMRRPPCP
jgi:predicted enzyme related to lactoylglutathione lyase